MKKEFPFHMFGFVFSGQVSFILLISCSHLCLFSIYITRPKDLWILYRSTLDKKVKILTDQKMVMRFFLIFDQVSMLQYRFHFNYTNTCRLQTSRYRPVASRQGLDNNNLFGYKNPNFFLLLFPFISLLTMTLSNDWFDFDIPAL